MTILYQGDCLEVMKKFENNTIDMVLTSPPYDNLRTYDNTLVWNFDIFKKIANELYRVVKKGGIVVWIVNDATIKGSETGTSFKQALYFKEIGFNIHDTMIWNKPNVFNFGSNNCYRQAFEYMFIFSKDTPKSINFIRDIDCKMGGSLITNFSRIDGVNIKEKGQSKINEKRKRTNVWVISNFNKKKYILLHSLYN